eukprot:703552-Pyramimonas_sp.AAC.1
MVARAPRRSENPRGHLGNLGHSLEARWRRWQTSALCGAGWWDGPRRRQKREEERPTGNLSGRGPPA